MNPANDNEPLKIGDRVQLRQFPDVQGYIWDIVPREKMVIVQWDDPEEDVYVRNVQHYLQKITPPLAAVASVPAR
jgi:hypothetical protein